MAEDEQDQTDPDFEEVVAALLKVDPAGIIGKDGKAARKAKEDQGDQC